MTAGGVTGALAVALMASVIACGGNVQISGSGGAGTSTSTAGQGGGTSTGGAGAGGTGGGLLTTSNPFCSSAAECGEGQFCDDPSNLCFTGGQGVCDPVEPCANKGPVCGCDGAIHETDCAAFQAGVDVSTTGCEVPPGQFACGIFLCETGAQACFHYVGFATYDACEDYPAVCDPPSCACFPDYCQCVEDMNDDFIVTCPTGD